MTEARNLTKFEQAGPVPFTPEGPQPLVREMPEPAMFPVEALGPLRGPAEAIARATEAPVAMCAASVLAVAALATQGRRDVETLGGTAPISAFFLTIAESGERKSTADRLAMRGVRLFEANLRENFERERTRFLDALAVWEASRKRILNDKGSDDKSKRAALLDLGSKPSAPLQPVIVARSPTIEGITRHLGELRGSLGVMTEEGGALLGGYSMKAENRLAACAAFSAMWDGSPIDRMRASDGVSLHAGRRFSAHLLVQPVAAESLLADPVANGQGLLARFLISKPASRIGQRLRIEPDLDALPQIDAFAEAVKSHLARPLALADGALNELSPPVLKLEKDARGVLVEFARGIEKAQAAGGPFESVRAFASKAAEHATRLAAAMTVFADPDATHVKGEAMANGAVLATYFAQEASRLLEAAQVPPEVADALRLAAWLRERWHEECVSAAIAAQQGPFKLTSRNREALRLLERHGHLTSEDGAIVAGKSRREAWRIVR